jgi:hypothetical protein
LSGQRWWCSTALFGIDRSLSNSMLAIRLRCSHGEGSALELREELHMSDSEQDMETRIRKRAYALWDQDGRPEGRTEEYWEKARRLIEAEDDPKAPDMTADPPL